MQRGKGEVVRKLHKQGDMSVREIAAALGLTTQTVYWHPAKSRTKGVTDGRATNGGAVAKRTVRRSK